MPVSKKAKPAPRGDKPSAAMVRIGNNLAELKARMISATDLKLPMVFFMDALVDDEHFMAAGKLSNDKTVKALFRQVAKCCIASRCQRAARWPSICSLPIWPPSTFRIAAARSAAEC